MIGFCKTRVDQSLYSEFSALSPTDDETARKIGIRIATESSRKLLEGGVPGLHFYTLNLEKVLVGTLANLGILPNGEGTITDGTTTTTMASTTMNGKQEKEVVIEKLPLPMS